MASVKPSTKITSETTFFIKACFSVFLLVLLAFPTFAGTTNIFIPEKTETLKPRTPVTVYIFLSETCPISQYYTLTLKALYQEFGSEQVQFIGVFPNSYSTPETIAAFKKKYDIPFTLQPDPKQQLTKTLGATITPEVVVKNTVSGAIFYKGRIDDSYQRVGKRRTVITSPDLKNALTDIQNNQPVRKPETNATGCYITLVP